MQRIPTNRLELAEDRLWDMTILMPDGTTADLCEAKIRAIRLELRRRRALAQAAPAQEKAKP